MELGIERGSKLKAESSMKRWIIIFFLLAHRLVLSKHLWSRQP
ncbi:hypothetical protein D1BOALGB6SA_8851 [Olavius sp. associated proteobacterium Delta 1]|nr:hypothetical protein D1BOALGB6SA_8851 [Olavius sp. associated proteobacterium Delta 1]